MKANGIVGLVGFLLVSTLACAQNFDTTYIKSYKDKFFLWPVTKQRQLSFKMQDPGGGKSAEFKPNNSSSLGLGVYMFDLGLEIVFPLPLPQEKDDIYGKTRATDLQLNIISRRWGADVVYQRYKGFYLSNPDVPVPPGFAYPQRPDIVTENLGINGFYVFNGHRFSFRSAFTFADRQLRSSGGFLVAGTFNQFEIDGDSAILNPTYTALLGQTTQFTSLDLRTYGLVPGYAHNFIIKRNYFLSMMLALGPALQDFRYTDISGLQHTNTRMNSFIDSRIAFGYSNDRFFTGLTLSLQLRNLLFEEIRFTSASSTARILFGWRFKESGFLKKSVWDLLPPWGKKRNQPDD